MWHVESGKADCLGNVGTFHVYCGSQYVATFAGNLYDEGSIEAAKRAAMGMVDYYTRYPLPN